MCIKAQICVWPWPSAAWEDRHSWGWRRTKARGARTRFTRSNVSFLKCEYYIENYNRWHFGHFYKLLRWKVSTSVSWLAGIGNFQSIKCGIFACNMCSFHLATCVCTRQVFSNSVSIERAWRPVTRCQPPARRTSHTHCGELVCALRAVKRLGSNIFKWLFTLDILGQEVRAVDPTALTSCHMFHVVSAYLTSEGLLHPCRGAGFSQNAYNDALVRILIGYDKYLIG